MALSLNVLNHLGINLYSNAAAVVAEVVANAWDADAQRVRIAIDPRAATIVIEDDGVGMSLADINAKYLFVGYQRRSAVGESVTPRFGRRVMGRKGIGKLSLFSIAETIELHTVKSGEHHAFRMGLADIRHAIANGVGDYHPTPLDASVVEIVCGTRIILRDLKKRVSQTPAALQRRMARRFCVIGAANHFEVEINGIPVSPMDRDYFHKLQYLWYYGDDGASIRAQCQKLDETECRDGTLGDSMIISGWLGSVHNSGQLKDEYGENLNRIVVMVRGKLAQEDILDEFAEGGVYTKYLMGELHADFLDTDGDEDIATSNRQRIIEDDPRYQALRNFVLRELRHIANLWRTWRNDGGTKRALEIPAVEQWYTSLPPDYKRRAESLFGKINQLTIDSDDERRRQIKYGVLAFESLRYKSNLDALDAISLDNLEALAVVFASLDDIEATLYYQIVKERIGVIKKLREQVEENARERVIQDHVFTHLWLLDPAWERATETEFMEQQMQSEFDSIDAGLTDDERRGRVDIKYRLTSGKHVVIELKRADRVLTTDELVRQVKKYQGALRKLLRRTQREKEPMEIVVVLGREPRDWVDADDRESAAKQLKIFDARIVFYQALLENAYRAYQEFLDKGGEAGRIFKLIQQIDAEAPE